MRTSLNINTAVDRIPDNERTTLSIVSAVPSLFGFIKVLLSLIVSFPVITILLLVTSVIAICDDQNPEEPEIQTAEDIEILTLEEALAIAISDNKNIDNALLEVEKANDAIKATRTRLFPEFDFSIYELYHLTDEAFTFQKGVFGDIAGIGPIPPETVKIQTSPDFTTFLTATVGQPISQLYEISLLVKQRQIQKELSDEDLRFRRQEVADRVKKTYYNILKYQSTLEAVREKIIFLKELYILVNRYVEVERALESESLEVKARLGRVEYEDFKLKNDLATEKERLNKLLGRDIETPFAVAPVPSAEPIVIDIKNAEELALFQRPEVRAAKLGIEFAENEVRIKKSKYIPEIGIEFQYTANPDIELLPENIATIGVFAKWDVFDWGRKQKQIAEKKKAVLQARNELEQAESDVLIDVNSEIRKLEEAAVLINVTEMEEAAARERLRVEMNKYREGSALLQGVLEAESSLEEKNSDYQKAVLEYWTARAELEKAMGEE